VIELISLLISHNHNPLDYGLTFFTNCIKQIYKEKSETIRNIAIAMRVAKFGDDKSFREFVEIKEEVKVSDEELLCL